MISSIVSRLVILVFGTLYPAYASYKAVRTKNVKEYVKWMMYWIVFALFTCAETFTDVFLSFWFPFYYEIKIILVLWLLSPATKGSSILYRKFVHPMFSRREQEIDDYIAKAKEQGYHTVLHLGTKGVNYATTVLMQTAIKSSLLVYKGGGGLVNQIRRSYSLSDLSSEKESDMNRNSKALNNVSDEDDMEETDGLDPRLLKPKGYSPRRSASGSSRMEMYFPEVDVDVLQHGSSRPREPTIPLSHIRSSEDVSSGYSSAEPLYTAQHATKSEGLVPSGEPLVRTASVGSTRSMRTKSSRGGVVVKRGSAAAATAAEDSELLDLQDGEADYHYQEDYFSDISSSLSSRASKSVPFPVTLPLNRSAVPLSSVPEISYPSAQRKVILMPSKLNDISAQLQYIDDSDVKSDSPDDEDMPLYDAESDDSKTASNDLLSSEPMVPLLSDDCICTGSHETALSTDVTMLHEDRAVNDKIHYTTVTFENFVFSDECLTSHLDITTNNTLPDNLAAPADDNIDQTFAEKKNEVSTEEESPVVNVKDLPFEHISSQHEETETKTLIKRADIVSGSLEAKIQNLDLVSDSLKKHINLCSVAQPKHMIPEVTEDLGTVSRISDIKETVEKDETSVSELKDLNTEANETVTETLSAAVMSTVTVPSSESLCPDNVVDISLESQDSKCDIGVNQAISLVDNNFDLNATLVDADRQTPEILQAVVHETPKLNRSSVISTCGDGSGEALQIEDSDVKPLQDYSGSAYASIESLALPDPPSRSSSQGSLRKEGRAGRYHKRPAPTPPPKNSEAESEDWAEVRDSQILCDANSKAVAGPKEPDGYEPSPKATKREGSESAVTARLVLKPGVVKSLGPDSGTRTEVFVSRTPQMKSKNSKSKIKEGNSALSQLFVHPKSQLGGFSSLFPFWHGKQEAHAPVDIQSLTAESPALKGSSSSPFVAVQENTSCGPSGSRKDKSGHSSYVDVKEMSCSPGKRRRAPLAGWE